MGFYESWNEELRRNAELAVQNSCRELVEVEKGNEWKIRKFIDKYPDTCWKFSSSSTLIPFEYRKLAEPSSSSEDLPMFHCRLVHNCSPFELSVQPKFLDTAHRKMRKMINNFYENNAENFDLTEEQFIPGVACVAKFSNEWHRAKIQYVTTGELVEIIAIDYGTLKVVSKSHVKRLSQRFGRIPPMALACRVRDVFVTNLDVHIVEKFKKDMENLGNLARCQLTTMDEPFIINLFHPTISNLDLCAHLRKSFSATSKPGKVEYDESGDDEDGSDESEGEGEAGTFYVREFERSEKATRFIDKNFKIVHIEHPNLIFVGNMEMERRKAEMEEQLQKKWEALPILPKNWMTQKAACCLKTQNGAVKRGAIDFIDEDYLEVLLIDYGIIVKIEKKKTKSGDVLKAVPDEELFSSVPQILAISLEQPMRMHLSAIQKIKLILPIGTSVHFEPYRSSKQIPIRGRIKTNDICDVQQQLYECLLSSRIDINCSDLVAFSPKIEIVDHSNSCLKDFVYRFNCSSVLTKSNFCALSLP